MGSRITVAVVGAVILLNLAPVASGGAERLGDAASIVQLLATAVIIITGAVFAYRKRQLFRDFEPHLTVTQSATHRAVGTQYVHIAVTASVDADILLQTHQMPEWNRIKPLTEAGLIWVWSRSDAPGPNFILPGDYGTSITVPPERFGMVAKAANTDGLSVWVY